MSHERERTNFWKRLLRMAEEKALKACLYSLVGVLSVGRDSRAFIDSPAISIRCDFSDGIAKNCSFPVENGANTKLFLSCDQSEGIVS